MAKVTAHYNTLGGGTVTLHRGGVFAALNGNGTWFECTGCRAKEKVTRWDSEVSDYLVDYDATETAAAQHAFTCLRKPK